MSQGSLCLVKYLVDLDVSWIYIDTDELPGLEVAPGSINILRIDPKKEHQETSQDPVCDVLFKIANGEIASILIYEQRESD